MEEVVIRKKDLDRLAKTLLKEIFEFIQDKDSLKELKRDFLNYLIYSNNKDKENEYSSLLENILNKESTFEDFLKLVEDSMKNDNINTEDIYYVAQDFKLDMETDEDLYYKKEAFLDIFRVFETGYTYLNN